MSNETARGDVPYEGSPLQAWDLLRKRAEKAEAEVQRWQDISTAPRDMNPVLLFWPYWTQEPVIGERNYIAEESIKFLDSWHTEKWLGEDAEDPGPTHWMPLPQPPQPLAALPSPPAESETP